MNYLEKMKKMKKMKMKMKMKMIHTPAAVLLQAKEDKILQICTWMDSTLDCANICMIGIKPLSH